MIETHNYSDKKWIQLISPDNDELAELAKTYDLDPRAVQDLSSPTPRQKVETYDNFIYIVFHIPAYKHSHTKSHLQEVDFIIGEDYIITVQYDSIDALHTLSKEAEFNNLLGKEPEEISPGLIFVEILNALYGSLADEISFMRDKLKEIEENIFKGKERRMVSEISKVSRDLLDIKRTITPQANHFEKLLHISKKSKNIKFTRYIKAIYENKYLKIHEEVEHDANLVVELRETNNSLVSTKQNEVMKNLTIMAFITFPLTLVTGIFGMNTISTPIVGHPEDFWMIFSFMIIATLIMFMFFKFKKWI